MRPMVFAIPLAVAVSGAHAAPLQHGIPVASLLRLIGVDTHLEYNDGYGMYADPALVGSAMRYLGVARARDGVPTPGNSSFYAATQNFDVLANPPYDIRFELILGDDTQPVAYDQALLDRLFTTPANAGLSPVPAGAVAAIEGLNEINNERPEPTQAEAVAWQERLACLTASLGFCGAIGVAVDAHVAEADVVMFTGNETSIPLTSTPGTTFPAWAANAHPYVYATQTALPSDVITGAFAGSDGATPSPVNAAENQPSYPAGLVMSESGAASTDGGGDTPGDDPYYALSFDDRTMAVRDLDTVLDGLAIDAHVFLYQLFANYTFAQSSDETYGLFRYAGRAADGSPIDTPTPAATALHLLTGTLAGGEATPQGTDCLEWNNPGAPASEHAVLGQYSAGQFRLVVWNEGTDWNAATHTPVVQPGFWQSVVFRYPVSGYILDPIADRTYPFSDATTVGLYLQDAPNIIVLQTTNPADGGCAS